MPSPPSFVAASSPASSPWDHWLADVFAQGTGDPRAVAESLQSQGCAEPSASLLAASGWLRHHRPNDRGLMRAPAGRQVLAMLRVAAKADSLLTSTPPQGDPQSNAVAGTRVRLTTLAPKAWLLDDVLKSKDCAALEIDAGEEGRQRMRSALLTRLTPLAERFYGAALGAPQFEVASWDSTAVLLLAWLADDDTAWLHLPSQALACRVQQGGGLLIQFQGQQGQADPLGKVLFQQLSQQLTQRGIPSIALHWAVQA